ALSYLQPVMRIRNVVNRTSSRTLHTSSEGSLMPSLCEMLGLCVLACGGPAVGRPLPAQPSELYLGDVARVSATTPALRRFIGRVVVLTDDTLALQTDEPVARIAISRAALTST